MVLERSREAVSDHVPVQPEEIAEACRRLDELLTGMRGEALLIDQAGKRGLPLPPKVLDLLRQVVRELAAGKAVTVHAISAEVTPREAAELLNVSRPFVVKLLDTGTIPYHLVGAHRRIRLADVLAYRQQRGNARRDALREMAQEAQEMGLYE